MKNQHQKEKAKKKAWRHTRKKHRNQLKKEEESRGIYRII